MRDSDLSPQQRNVRDVLEERFQGAYINEMRRELEPIDPPGKSTIASPRSMTSESVRAWGSGEDGSLRSQAPHISVGGDAQDFSVGDTVAGRLGASDHRMDDHEKDSNFTTGGIHQHGDHLRGTVQARHDAWNLRTIPAVEALKGSVEVDATPLAAREGVHIKPGTNIRNLDPEIVPAISSVASSSRSMGLTAPTITSGRDRHHTRGSLHPKGDALDFRGNNLTNTEGRVLAQNVRGQLGRDYDVNFETFHDPTNNHLHVEYDPKIK